MAVHKAKRSNPLAQPERRRPHPQLKPWLFDNLHQLNRGYGVALAALDRLQKPGIFPRDCLQSYRSRTEALRALANRDLLYFLAGHEERDAERFERVPKKRARRSPKDKRNRRT
jgi:hypothetical protein